MKTSVAFLRAFAREFQWWIVALVLVLLIGLGAGLVFVRTVQGLAVAAGVTLFFFFPGFAFSYILLPPTRAPWLLRLLLAIVFSLAIEPVTVFILSRFGMPVTITTSIVVSVMLTVIGLLIAVAAHRNFSPGAEHHLREHS